MSQNLIMLRDEWHIAGNLLREQFTNMTKEDYEFRYEQTGDTYRLQGFYGAPDINRTAHGSLSTRPEWLAKIVDVALVANTVSRAPAPPPDLILWFRTDKQFNLTEYINV